VRLPLVVLALAACGNKSASTTKEVTGTLSVKGEAVTVTKCHPDRGIDGVYVILETTKGALRFEAKKLYWNGDDPEGFRRGATLDCTKVDRSWGGGSRTDGTAYFRGTLDFDCHDGPNKIAGNLTLDCGNITAEERAQLDKQRKDLQDEQKKWQGAGARPGSDTGAGPGSGTGSN
jgi:hypothetical protein